MLDGLVVMLICVSIENPLHLKLAVAIEFSLLVTSESCLANV